LVIEQRIKIIYEEKKYLKCFQIGWGNYILKIQRKKNNAWGKEKLNKKNYYSFLFYAIVTIG